MVRKLIAALLLTALLWCAVCAGAEGFEGFDVIIVDDGDDTAPNSPDTGIYMSPTSSDDEDGLQVKIGANHIYSEWNGEKSGSFVWLAFDAEITNWTLDTLTVVDALKATLTYQDTYAYNGEVVFERDQIGMLDRLNGQIVFKIPHIVALAQPEELELKTEALYETGYFPADLTAASAALRAEKAVPFEYTGATGSEIVTEGAYIIPAYKTNRDDISRYFTQRIQLINWNTEPIKLDETTLTGSITYRNKYIFPGHFDYTQETLEPFEITNCVFWVRLPLTVADDVSGEVILTLNVDEQEEEYVISIADATEAIKKLVPQDAFEWNGHHYYCYSDISTWEEAEEFCESLGGHLATMTSPEENEALYNYITTMGYMDAYFGFTDSVTEGEWLWINGEVSDYSNWTRGQPDDAQAFGGEDYAQFWSTGTGGTWNDANGTLYTNNTGEHLNIYLCEWDF